VATRGRVGEALDNDGTTGTARRGCRSGKQDETPYERTLRGIDEQISKAGKALRVVELQISGQELNAGKRR
jgi:hypothetical protein